MKKNREEQLALKGTEEGEILSRLTERVERAIATIQDLRRERDGLKTRLATAEAKLQEQHDAGDRLTKLEEEHERLGIERGEIRNRIQSILSSLDALEGGE